MALDCGDRRRRAIVASGMTYGFSNVPFTKPFYFLFQIVTTVPSKKLPKALVAGAGEPPDMSALLEMKDSNEDGDKRTGQILWIRGLTRLQTQVCKNKFSGPKIQTGGIHKKSVVITSFTKKNHLKDWRAPLASLAQCSLSD